MTRVVPKATKSGYSFVGWYTNSGFSTKVIDSDSNIQSNVSGWTNTSGDWAFKTENDRTLYAHFVTAQTGTNLVCPSQIKNYPETGAASPADGQQHEISLSNDYTGTIEYRSKESSTGSWSSWSTNKPKRDIQGTTYVEVRVKDSSGTTKSCGSATISLTSPTVQPSNPSAPTISGGTTVLYNSEDRTLHCNATNYSDGTVNYYSFGYSNSESGTPGNWTEASTEKMYKVAGNAYYGTRYYSCRVYTKKGVFTSNTVVSSNKTEVTNKRAKITFDANGGTLSGNSVYYVEGNTAGLFTSETGGSPNPKLPTASKNGATFTDFKN